MSKIGYDYLFVVKEIFSKMCILITCKKIVIGQEVVYLFFSHIWVHFSLYNSIIFYKRLYVFGRFCTCLLENMDIRIKQSIDFHYQTNGQIEVVNRIIAQLLQGYYEKYVNT